MVKVYKSHDEYIKDAKRMASKGFKVVSVVQEKRKPGCGRIGCMGLFAFLFPPRDMFVVTYEKE